MGRRDAHSGTEKHPKNVPGYGDLKSLARRIVLMRHDARAELYREIAAALRKDAVHDFDLKRPKHAKRMHMEASTFEIAATCADETWKQFKKYME